MTPRSQRHPEGSTLASRGSLFTRPTGATRGIPATPHDPGCGESVGRPRALRAAWAPEANWLGVLPPRVSGLRPPNSGRGANRPDFGASRTLTRERQPRDVGREFVPLRRPAAAPDVGSPYHLPGTLLMGSRVPRLKAGALNGYNGPGASRPRITGKGKLTRNFQG